MGTGEFVKSRSFAMEVLPGVGHFVMDQARGRRPPISCWRT
jgi:hypothetical protein